MQERQTNINQDNNFGGIRSRGSSAETNKDDYGSGGVGNFILKIESDIKQAIFRTMYLVVKDCDISLRNFSLLLFIEFLQMIQYAFSENLKSAWKNDKVFSYVSYFLSFTHIVPWMSKVTKETYFAIFYVCVGILCCTILSFIYTSYQSTRAKVYFEWPQKLLRGICIVTTTVIFLPCLELLNSMLVCERQKNDVYVHYIFKDQKCWTGIHIIHATIAIICSLIYIMISLLITLTYFKNMSSNGDASAKSDARADIQRLIQKIIVVYIFLFLNTEKEQWFIIILYFILSAFTLERYFVLRSFHSEIIQLQHNLYRAVCLWSNIAILISKVLQQTSFNGGFQLFFLGIPLVIGLVIFARDHRRDDLMLNTNKFQTGDEVAGQIKFLLSIIGKKESGDKNAEILLNGFIYMHEDQCPNLQCHLKTYKKNIALQLSGQAKKTRTSASITKHMAQAQKQDNFQLLMQHCRNMYRSGIQKFPNSPALRIQFANFLIEKLNKKQEALSELNHASLMHPTFDEQFVIFRNKKFMEECFEEQQLMGQQNNNGPSSQSEKGDKYGQANQNAVDLMTRFAFENTFRQLSQQIEKCAEFHMEFWNQLKNDRPDLGKLGDCGSRINNCIGQVESLWFELNKINSNAPKAMKLYGRYQIDILQDKEQGQDYLQRAKDASNMKQNFFMGGSESINDILSISSDGTPCIFVSGDQEKLSYITQCNSGAVRVFGYQDFELKNQKVEKLMPEMYGKNHSKILEEALAKGPENIPNKERLVFAKHKSGYVFPVWLQLKLIQSLTNEISFIALFKTDKKMMSSNVGFILINKEKKIQAMSSSCIKLMNLDNNWIRKVQQQGYDIQKLAPDLESRKDEMLSSKGGLIVEWIIPFFQKKKWIKKASHAVDQYNKKKKPIQKGSPEQLSSNSKPKQQLLTPDQNVTINKKIFKFICNIQPINMGSLGEIGSYIRLDTVRVDIFTLNSGQKYSIKQPLFQFRFDYYTGRFIRELRSSQNPFDLTKNPCFIEGHDDHYFKQSTHESSLNGDEKPLLNKQVGDGENTEGIIQQNQIISLQQHEQTPSFEDWFHKKKKWSKGIEVYTLRDGKVQHKDQVDEEKRMMDLEEMKMRKQEEEERNMQQLTNFTNNIKSKNALKSALNNSQQSSAIRNLRTTMNIVILFLLALAVSEFTVNSQQFQEINQNFGLIQKSYLRISEIQRVAYGIRSLILINEKRLNNYQDYQTQSSLNPDFRDYLKLDIEKALNSLYDLQDFISLSPLTLSYQHKKLIMNKEVPLYFLEQSQLNLKVINFTLPESVLQLSSAIFTVRHLPLDKFNETQEDIFFVIYNSFNEFFLTLLKSSEYFEKELYVRAREKTNLLLTLFIVSICIVLLSIPFLFPAVNSVNKTKDRILLLFIEIPNGFIGEMSQRCEQFLLSLTSDDKQDEIKTEDGQDSQKGTGGQIRLQSDQNNFLRQRQISKQPKNSSNTSKNFFFQFTFVVLLIIAYFTSMFLIAKTYLMNIEAITQELSLAAYNEAHFAYMQNVQREMIYNHGKKVEDRDSFNISKEILDEIYEQVQNMIDQHQSNRKSVNMEYMTKYSQIMNQDLCIQKYLDLNLIPQDCSNLFNNAPTHGLQSILIVYFELLREQLTTYQSLLNLNNRVQQKNATNPKNNSASNIVQQQQQFVWLTRNQTDLLLSSQTFKQLYWLQFRFLQDAFRTLIDSLSSTTSADFESSVNTKMAVFIVFMIAVVLAYLIIWTPFVNYLSKDILSTRMMLTIVPIHIIMKIPKIQEFLNKQIAGKSISNHAISNFNNNGSGGKSTAGAAQK